MSMSRPWPSKLIEEYHTLMCFFFSNRTTASVPMTNYNSKTQIICINLDNNCVPTKKTTTISAKWKKMLDVEGKLRIFSERIMHYNMMRGRLKITVAECYNKCTPHSFQLKEIWLSGCPHFIITTFAVFFFLNEYQAHLHQKDVEHSFKVFSLIAVMKKNAIKIVIMTISTKIEMLCSP